jgi:hypothetical protein
VNLLGGVIARRLPEAGQGKTAFVRDPASAMVRLDDLLEAVAQARYIRAAAGEV